MMAKIFHSSRRPTAGFWLSIGMLVRFAFAPATLAEVVNATVHVTVQPQVEHFNMGEARSPNGTTITLDSRSLRLNDVPWTPVMGEFHFSRYPANEWREELLKMKAGGIDIVATYVFWIHHEEMEGEWNWSGRRNLRRFVETAGEAGLKVIVRCGPWCHGEVRHGGQPDWLLENGWRLRSNDPDYLARARILYQEIAAQLTGLLWKDGGPIIGIQLENEYRGRAEHLLTLKRMAREFGLDVPLYTRTGWPALGSPMPFGEIAPLYGVYAEGFWDREITPMPGRYWAGFHFSKLRTDANIANEVLGRSDVQDAPDVARYPYLTCEIGGGMMNSYHRRIYVYPDDIESTTLVKIGSGSTSPGYYMYHGGVNPQGKLSTLMESQANGEWNDLPVKSYDFQAPLGQHGQIRPHYHSLRRLHLFLKEWGSALAEMPPTLPDERPSGKEDFDTLRWSIRSDGQSGFVFVNNYQRLEALPPKPDIQFSINLPEDIVSFPAEPVTIPSGSRFLWPFNLDLGNGIRLDWASAQPVYAVDNGAVRTVFFAATEGVPTEFAFDSDLKLQVKSGKATHVDGRTIVRRLKPGTRAAIELTSAKPGQVNIVLLSEADSLNLWTGRWQDAERVFLTGAGLIIDRDTLRLTSPDRSQLNVGIHPPPPSVFVQGESIRGKPDGVFTRYSTTKPRRTRFKAKVEAIQSAGPARETPMGKSRRPVAAAPEDTDFERAAVWRIKLPNHLDLTLDPILRLHYVGDVARVTLNGELLTDDFYNGKAFDIGLRRYAPEILEGDLQVSILPLRKDAPIYMAEEAKPVFGENESIVELKAVEIVPHYAVELHADADHSTTR